MVSFRRFIEWQSSHLSNCELTMKWKLFPVLHFQFIAVSHRSVPLQWDGDRLGEIQTTVEFLFWETTSRLQGLWTKLISPTAPAVSSPPPEPTGGRPRCHLGADMFQARRPEIRFEGVVWRFAHAWSEQRISAAPYKSDVQLRLWKQIL